MKEISDIKHGSVDLLFGENKVKNGWFEKELMDWQINSGEITTQKVNRTNYITMDSFVFSQVKQRVYLVKRHTYYLSIEVNVFKYDQGTFGVKVYGNLENGNNKLLGKKN